MALIWPLTRITPVQQFSNSLQFILFPRDKHSTLWANRSISLFACRHAATRHHMNPRKTRFFPRPSNFNSEGNAPFGGIQSQDLYSHRLQRQCDSDPSSERAHICSKTSPGRATLPAVVFAPRAIATWNFSPRPKDLCDLIVFVALHIVEDEHRLVILGQLLDGGLQIDPIKQSTQLQVWNPILDFQSSYPHHQIR